MDISDLSVVDNQDESRWEARWGDQIATLTYKIVDQEITLIKTWVPEQIEARGVGSKLVQTALEQARQNNYMVVPRCPFVAAFIKKHPHFLDLVSHW